MRILGMNAKTRVVPTLLDTHPAREDVLFQDVRAMHED
jgi:hypothetical protein